MRDKRLRELIYEYQLTKNMKKKDSIISEVMDYYSHVVRLELLSNYAYLSKDSTKYNYLMNIGQTAAIEAIETYQTAGKDSFQEYARPMLLKKIELGKKILHYTEERR